jgi:hypothetical protein
LRILLDECVDRRFARSLPGFDVVTVPQMGWAGIKNGSLLRLAEKEFDVLVTVDRNLSYQQDVSGFDIALVVMKVVSNRAVDLEPLGPKIIALIDSLESGKIVLVS